LVFPFVIFLRKPSNSLNLKLSIVNYQGQALYATIKDKAVTALAKHFRVRNFSHKLYADNEENNCAFGGLDSRQMHSGMTVWGIRE